MIIRNSRKEKIMSLLEIAVDMRIKQLERKMNAETNPLIKEIVSKEILQLKKEWSQVKK